MLKAIALYRRLGRVRTGVEWLAQFGAVAIKRDCFEHELPAEQVGPLDVFEAGRVRHVDCLGNRTTYKRLARSHHVNVRLGREIALAGLAARVGAVEDRVMLPLQVR